MGILKEELLINIRKVIIVTLSCFSYQIFAEINGIQINELYSFQYSQRDECR